MNKTINKELILLQDLGMLYATSKSIKKYRYGIYKCYCGNEFKARTTGIKNQRIKSCGCLKKTTNREVQLKHGMHGTSIYTVWSNAIQRCVNHKNKAYKDYGARGISVCDEWKNDFMSFHEWALESGYKKGLTLDRKENNGNYEPNNCRWVERIVQSRNTRKLHKHNKSGYRGVVWREQRKKWCVYICVNNKQIRVGAFIDKIQAAKAYDQYVIDNNLEHTRNFS